MRTLFFGTPDFAVPSLDALADISDVVAVVCQPDKPAGRGLAVMSPAVKVRATERGLVVHQPTKIKTPEFAAWARSLDAEVALVVAYGRILPPALLAATRRGFLNVHASLLPKYRGAAPITWAIVNGERETGITLMQLDAGMDTGPMLFRVATPISEDETAGNLTKRLALLGAELVRKELANVAAGRVKATPQDASLATLAPIVEKAHAAIDWTLSAQQIHNLVRGMNPRPGAFSHLAGKLIKVHATRPSEFVRAASSPGEVILADKARVAVACGANGDDAVELLVVQPEGRKAVSALEWERGRGVKEGDRFT